MSVGAAATLHGPLTVVFGLVNAQGAMIDAGKKTVQAPAGDDYRLAFPVQVESGRYRLRVAAADANASVGSVETPISAVGNSSWCV